MKIWLKLFVAFFHARLIRSKLGDDSCSARERVFLDFGTGNEKKALKGVAVLLGREDLDPEIRISVLRARASYFIGADEPDAALRDYEVLMAIPALPFGVWHEALLGRAVAFAKKGDFSRAIALCEELGARPNLPEYVKNALIQCLCFFKCQANDLAGALKVLRDILDSPHVTLAERSHVLPLYRELLSEGGETAETLKLLTEIIEAEEFSDEVVAGAYFDRGVLYANDALYRMAESDFSKVLAYPSISLAVKKSAHLCRSSARRELGNLDGALLDRAEAFACGPWVGFLRRNARVLLIAFAGIVWGVLLLLSRFSSMFSGCVWAMRK
ncbi:MAG: hypothetical protein LBG65_03665 [Puniceicoccales bacterium]|jgi:tetratricopeptide (TPR) repeat protein|nr:hypothetical protein [Puniceicoccales bacterium]